MGEAADTSLILRLVEDVVVGATSGHSQLGVLGSSRVSPINTLSGGPLDASSQRLRDPVEHVVVIEVVEEDGGLGDSHCNGTQLLHTLGILDGVVCKKGNQLHGHTFRELEMVVQLTGALGGILVQEIAGGALEDDVPGLVGSVIIGSKSGSWENGRRGVVNNIVSGSDGGLIDVERAVLWVLPLRCVSHVRSP